MTRLSRKQAGAYYTPDRVVWSLVRWAIRDQCDRLLDPSCGDGRFIAAHHNSVGVEQDADAAAVAMDRAPYIKPLHWYVTCRLVLEGGFHPDELKPRPPFTVTRRRGQSLVHFDPSAATGGEATILGGLKTKNVDIAPAGGIDTDSQARARAGRSGVPGRSRGAVPAPSSAASSPTVSGLTGGRMR